LYPLPVLKSLEQPVALLTSEAQKCLESTQVDCHTTDYCSGMDSFARVYPMTGGLSLTPPFCDVEKNTP